MVNNGDDNLYILLTKCEFLNFTLVFDNTNHVISISPLWHTTSVMFVYWFLILFFFLKKQHPYNIVESLRLHKKSESREDLRKRKTMYLNEIANNLGFM